ncbi:hypothetical protein POJ06DRAFT_253199 [Lipomyces tetrasporus]|uniref:Uncharacterized protein n=1 Tax=Lipomyces tetrasporus TaxID=54092 RepID=A0AAD7QSH6_9ASCO|nr:uncharacterized protein POJ06DRAFT_253199 [Lipomyces tetrasporus]KAJ8100604.1 hypothetical protein POJ06DRAFT_253199 [Lipomyces tetrasporus]
MSPIYRKRKPAESLSSPTGKTEYASVRQSSPTLSQVDISKTDSIPRVRPLMPISVQKVAKKPKKESGSSELEQSALEKTRRYNALIRCHVCHRQNPSLLSAENCVCDLCREITCLICIRQCAVCRSLCCSKCSHDIFPDEEVFCEKCFAEK